MWPFNLLNDFRSKSSVQRHLEPEHLTVRRLISRLAKGAQIADQEICEAYFALSDRLQSNCDSVASGRLATIGAICAHANHLAGELLPSAMEPIYYLGIEDLEGVRAYISHVAKQTDSYLGPQTKSGAKFLQQLADDDSLIVESYCRMYDAEDNAWRLEDADVPDVPSIFNLREND